MGLSPSMPPDDLASTVTLLDLSGISAGRIAPVLSQSGRDTCPRAQHPGEAQRCRVGLSDLLAKLASSRLPRLTGVVERADRQQGVRAGPRHRGQVQRAADRQAISSR